MPPRHTPPFRLTEETLSLCGELERLIGRLEGARATVPQPLLRKRNHVRTVRSIAAGILEVRGARRLTEYRFRRRS
jgi:hypothetical protein